MARPGSDMRVKSIVRYELKYLITWQQRDALIADLQQQMQPDSHGDATGNYTITSLYYDTATYDAYWEKIEGEKQRRKVRVRTYGEQTVQPHTLCYLEIKQRQDKTLTKKRVLLPYSDAVALDTLDSLAQRPDLSESDRATISEVSYLYHVRALQPACVVRYNRLALNGGTEYSDLRVTFDTELRGRIHDLTLLSTGHADDIYFLPPDICILEIKANHSVPYWLAQLANKHHCTMRRISKYCTALEACGALLARQKIIQT